MMKPVPESELSGASGAGLEKIADHLPGMVFRAKLRSGGALALDYVSSRCRSLHGVEPEVALGDSELILDQVHPEDREPLREALEAAAKSSRLFVWEGRMVVGSEIRWRRLEGHPGEVGGEPGEVVWFGYETDFTARKQAEEALRKAREQLLQAQKLEAVGRLAGGLAHDFNNLLGVVLGYAELLRLELPEAGAEMVDEIAAAAERGAGLTRQLLAFSRRQVLEPQVFRLGDLVSEMEKMLRRLIGEDVRLVVSCDPEAGPVEADPGQVEQVLMSLVLNAREAMPGGGQLSLEVVDEEVEPGSPRGEAMEPGSYTRLRVQDDGAGMDALTLSRVFEPFFTTKPEGGGAGLGLATVYGIVRQSGGFIWVDSEPGRGSTFDVYLPRVELNEPRSDSIGPGTMVDPGAAEKTILVAEDEEAVRKVVVATLESLGYRILAAADGEEALQVIDAGERPDLVVTDVVMPVLGGVELARRLRARQPDAPVLFMTGYTDDAVFRQGLLTPGSSVLQKPFGPRTLALKVREMLG